MALLAAASKRRPCFQSSYWFHIPEFARRERNLHCDVVHNTTVWVSRLVLDNAIQTSR